MNVILMCNFATETAERHGNVNLETRRKFTISYDEVTTNLRRSYDDFTIVNAS